MNESRIVAVYTVRLPYSELDLSRGPERLSVVQTGNYLLYARPCVAISAPAQLNCLPQFVAEPHAFFFLRFFRSNPLRDRTNDRNIRLNLDEGIVSA